MKCTVLYVSNKLKHVIITNAVFLFTSRNLANAGFAWHVVLIASFAVLKLLRNKVYVSITACFVNWKYKKNVN